MRFVVYGVIVSVLMLASVGYVGADEKAQARRFSHFSSWFRAQAHDNRLDRILLDNNICFEDFVAANRYLIPQHYEMQSHWEITDSLSILHIGNWPPTPSAFYIPEHVPCYKSYHTTHESWTQLEKQINVCIEQFYFIGRPEYYLQAEIVYVRRDAPPCVNEQGQRLQHHASFSRMLKEPYYSIDRFTDDPNDWSRYCIRDLARANPEWYEKSGGVYIYESYIPNPPIFIPKNAPLCRPIEQNSEDLYTISQNENVCMELLLEASGLELFQPPAEYTLMAPVDAPACYDVNGHRLRANDKAVYKPQKPEAFLDVARNYNVCLQDLWDANPVMNSWNGLELLLPDVIFIPDTQPCHFGTITFISLPHHSLYAISLLTNVCINRLVEANPQYPQLDDYEWMQEFDEVLTLTIPKRLPCYGLENQYTNPYMPIGYAGHTPVGFPGPIINYVCTTVDTSKEVDLTGHTPPVKTSYDTSLLYCVPRTLDMTVYYENTPYMLYKVRGWETYITIGQCFGIDPYELINLNAHQFPQAVKPPNTLLIPQPYNTDCWMLGKDIQSYYKHYLELTYKAGYLIDGVYTVNYGDTLSSIGRKYGYLPQWIADANHLPDSGMIYYLQELKMPTFPSLYTVVPVGGAACFTVLMSTTIYRLRRWRRNRYADKKKNMAA